MIKMIWLVEVEVIVNVNMTIILTIKMTIVKIIKKTRSLCETTEFKITIPMVELKKRESNILSVPGPFPSVWGPGKFGLHKGTVTFILPFFNSRASLRIGVQTLRDIC